MNLKEELNEIFYNGKKVEPFQSAIDKCEQVAIRYTIEVLESCIPKDMWTSYDTLVEDKITELNLKLNTK